MSFANPFSCFCLQGYRLDGYRIRCEFAKGGRAAGGFGGGGGRAPQKSEFRVKLTGLPRQTSWQVGVGFSFLRRNHTLNGQTVDE